MEKSHTMLKSQFCRIFWGRYSIYTNRTSKIPIIHCDNIVGIPLKKVTQYFLSIIKDATGFQLLVEWVVITCMSEWRAAFNYDLEGPSGRTSTRLTSSTCPRATFVFSKQDDSLETESLPVYWWSSQTCCW